MSKGVPWDVELINGKAVDVILALAVTKSLERTMKAWPECLEPLLKRAAEQVDGRSWPIESAQEKFLKAVDLLDDNGRVPTDILAILDAAMFLKDGYVRDILDPFSGESIAPDFSRLAKPSNSTTGVTQKGASEGLPKERVYLLSKPKLC